VRPRRLRVPSSVALALAATAPLPSPPLSPRGGSASDDAPSDASSAPARRRAAASARRRVPHPARPRGAPAGVDRAAAAAARADAAARAASAAWADAHAKCRRAAAALAAAVPADHVVVDAAPAESGLRLKRPRSFVGGAAPEPSPLAAHPLAGARLAVFSPGDGAFFRATVREVGGRLPPGSALLEYEDGKEELADLGIRRFRLLTPRASSAGCGAGLLAAALALGAEGVRVEPDAPSPPPATCGPPAGPESARRGAALLLRSPGSASWLRADVVGVAPAARRVRVLYEDGEDEWVDLAAEAARGDARAALAAPPLAAGLPPGLRPPSGPAAVGWRVALYWDAEAAFFGATVVSYDFAARAHTLSYDDGAVERVCLHGDVVKWLAPPPAVGAAAADPMDSVPSTPRTATTPRPAPAPGGWGAVLLPEDWCAAAAADAALPLGPVDADLAAAAGLPHWPPPAPPARAVDCRLATEARVKLTIADRAGDGEGSASGCSTASGAPGTPRTTLRHWPSSPSLDVTSPESSNHGASAALDALLSPAAAYGLAGGRMHGGAPSHPLHSGFLVDPLAPFSFADAAAALGW